MIKMQHVRGTFMCSRGARVFFEKHNLDWELFLKEGLPLSSVLKIDDEMARQVIQYALENDGK